MFDLYRGGAPSRVGPPVFGHDVEPDDDRDLPFVTTALWVGSGGDIALWMRSHKDFKAPLVLRAVPPGTMLSLRVRRILKTGTSAQDIVAFT